MRRLTWLTMTLLVCCATISAQHTGSWIHKLKDADLLFHIPAQSNAITKVTHGVDQQQIDHVGIIYRKDGQIMVIEATYDGVVLSPLSQVLAQPGKWLAGRVKGKIDRQQTLNNALAQLGKPYDFTFQRDDREIYCSELVEMSYVWKNGGRIFSPIPMSFHDESGNLLPYWVEFYALRGMDVPEGQPGSNPGNLSRDKRVKIITSLRHHCR